MFGKLQRTLVNRGYWDEAGAEGAGSGAGGSEDEAAAAAAKAQADAAAAAAKAAQDEADAKSKAKSSSEGTSDKEAELLKEVMKKKDKIKEYEAKTKELTDQLSKFEGIDVDQVRTLLKEREDQETQKLEAKGEWDRLKQRIVDEHKTEMSKVNETIASLQAQLEKSNSTIEELTIGHAFDNSTFIGEELTLTPSKARIIYGAHFDVEDGKIVAYDSPRSNKNRTQMVDGSGNSLSFEESIKRIIDADSDRDKLIKSKMKAGAGSTTQTKVKAPTQGQNQTGVDRIAAALAKSA